MQRKTKQYISCGAKCKITAHRDFVQYAEETILSEKQSPDTVVGYVKKNKLFAEIVTAKTFTERKTGKAFVLKTDGKTAEATYQALTRLKERCGSLFTYMFKSITFDNGSEFAASELFESPGVTVYYAHPYSAWERGQNEHFNGMLRRFIPKGKDISYLTQADLDRFAAKLNALPRRKAHFFHSGGLV